MEDNESTQGPLVSQLRRVIHDGIDYAASVLRLLQAQATAMALSTLSFVLIIAFAILCALTAFVLLSVAFGFWLTHVTGSAGWALLIIGGTYAIIAAALGGYMVRWLARLKS